MAYTDEELAAAVRGNDFKKHEGQPVLPPLSHPLAQRLNRSIVKEDGTLVTALGPRAQEALEEKGFVLADDWTRSKKGLATGTLRSGSLQKSASDAKWAAEVRNYVFAAYQGRPVLPVPSNSLGKHLRDSLVRSDGTVHTELGPLLQAALREKGFRVVQNEAGRVGLAPDTLRVRSLRAGAHEMNTAHYAPSAGYAVPAPTGAHRPSGPFEEPAPYGEPVPVSGVAACAAYSAAVPPASHGSAFSESALEQRSTLLPTRPNLPSLRSLGLLNIEGRQNSPQAGPSAPSLYRPSTPEHGREGRRR